MTLARSQNVCRNYYSIDKPNGAFSISMSLIRLYRVSKEQRDESRCTLTRLVLEATADRLAQITSDRHLHRSKSGKRAVI